jgi:hypothetical protein
VSGLEPIPEKNTEKITDKPEVRTPVTDLMDVAKKSFEKVNEKIENLSKPDKLSSDAKLSGIKQIEEQKVISMVIDQYISDEVNTYEIINKCGVGYDIENQRILKIFVKNIWDTINKLENMKLIDKKKLSEKKELFLEKDIFMKKVETSEDNLIKMVTEPDGVAGLKIDMSAMENINKGKN